MIKQIENITSSSSWKFVSCQDNVFNSSFLKQNLVYSNFYKWQQNLKHFKTIYHDVAFSLVSKNPFAVLQSSKPYTLVSETTRDSWIKE